MRLTDVLAKGVPFFNRNADSVSETGAREFFEQDTNLHGELGILFRDARERAGLSLRDVAESLHIQYRYLQAMEAGDFRSLPGKVYAHGYVRSYAHLLDLDVDRAIEMFRSHAPASDQRLGMKFPVPPPEGNVPGGAIILVASVLVVMLYAGWYASMSDRTVVEAVAPVAPAATGSPDAPGETGDIEPGTAQPRSQAGTAVAAVPPVVSEQIPEPIYSLSRPGPPAEDQTGNADAAVGIQQEEGVETAEAVAESSGGIPLPVLRSARAPVDAGTVETGTVAVIVPPAPGAPDAADATSAPAGPESRVVIRVDADSWVQVRAADATTVMTRVMRAGETYRVPDRAGLTLSTGNAGGLTILVDGQPVPRFGAPGDVVRNIDLDPRILASLAD